MHLEFLIEDKSGERMLELLLPRMIRDPHTFNIHSYKGIGRIPKNMRNTAQASKRILLDNLPKLLKGYGRTFSAWGNSYPAALVLICDSDDRCPKTFKVQLQSILAQCVPKPDTRFCFAIEEGEAWFLGDLSAVKKAYPKANDSVLNDYTQDSICGTWEKLADALYPGGHLTLERQGWMAVGKEKSEWAERITPHLDVDVNKSPSFHYFRDQLNQLLGN